MGNSESQYSIQGPRGSGCIIPGKQKPYSLKFRSTKEDALSPHAWWKGAPAGSGYKSRPLGRGCLSPHKSGHAYSSRHYDYVAKGARGAASPNGQRRRGSTERRPPSGTEEEAHGPNGHAAAGRGGEERDALEEQSSPRVVIKKDGSLRVEFTNALGGALLLPDDAPGPVQLLKFSPNPEAASTPSLPGSASSARRAEARRGSAPPPAAAATSSSTSTARTSKGSSLSSDGSWYDSPWGPGAELGDHEPSETLPAGSALQLDAPMSISDLYRDPEMAATFPSARDLSGRHQDPPQAHRASFASVLDVPTEEEACPEARQYSSYTLPCRKPKTRDPDRDQEQDQEQDRASREAGTLKKDSIRSRMRRLSDWTGSLSRKKRASQASLEPRYKDHSEAFDSGVDGLTADTSSPSQGSSLPWYPGNATAAGAGGGASRAQSAGALHQPGGDALRQNIYQNFMRELETGNGGGGGGGGRGERRDPSTGTEEGESGSESAEGSLEQLDLLFEKEQGVVRRAGWLSFKPLLTLHKDRKLELVTRRKWKQYWVTLKGCTLLFYETYGRGSAEQDLSARYALLAEDSTVQAVPEHPKKENVFCLSNTYGDVYLFQASNQTDLENWVTAVHSASASLLAKRHGKEDTPRLLRSHIRGLLQKVDMDGKMKKMAELQLTVVSDPKNRRAIENQIQQWEQNLEKFNMDLFRLRCYLASLQGGELPNPKSLLAAASRPSKAALGRLGIFSVSSFHALICSRDEATLRRRSVSLGQRTRRRGLFSSLKGLDNLTRRGREKRPSVSQVFEGDRGGHAYFLPPSSSERLDGLANIYSMSPPEGAPWDCGEASCVYTPDGLAVLVPVGADHTVQDVLSSACRVKQLDPSLHCLRLHRCVGQNVEVRTLGPSEPLQDLLFDDLEVVPVDVFTLHMTRPACTGDFGFAVTGHTDGQNSSRILVSEVLPDGLAFREGLRPGDEILVLNSQCVSSLDLALIQTLFAERTLQLTLRRDAPLAPPPLAPPPLASSPDSDPPAPPSNQSQLLQDFLDAHHRAKSTTDVSAVPHVPGDGESLDPGLENGLQHRHQRSHRPVQHSKSVDTVCNLYHSFREGPGSAGAMEANGAPPGRGQGGVGGGGEGGETNPLRPCPRHMSATERLRKVIQELVDTEKSYVKDLSCLFEIYLKPLQKETFLTLDEMESLFGSLPEMLDFQRVFLQTLEERIASSPDFSTLETPVQFKRPLFSLGGSFLYYADHFKLYSGFCANHIKVQKVLERAKTDRAFKEFLDARNPTKQHSSTLESYLIKPVQRVLKYPLLLRELVSLTDVDSEEHYHLTEALKAMEKVASHINEMQKIYEDYGSVFEQLVAEQNGPEKEVTELSMGEFLMHASAAWLNPHPSLGRMRRDPELTVFVFKKAVILVYRESNKLKKKMPAPRSAHSHGDLDPFKFRWLIPLSALQVRLGNTAGTETSCIWELIHTKSELEGRPETLFQLCSSVPECKVNIIKVIRSVLRENVRRHMRSDLAPAERGVKERLAPLHGTLPSSARIGSSRASWLCKPPASDHASQAGALKPGPADSDEGSLGSSSNPSSSGGPSSSSTAHVRSLPPLQARCRRGRPRSTPAKESDILGDDGRGESREGGSPASAIEAQFLRLALSEEAAAAASGHTPAPRVQPEGAEADAPEPTWSHFDAVKRTGGGGSLRGSQGALLSTRQHSRSLDSQTDGGGTPGDLSALLERDFSVQSLTSVVNEDCFYDAAEGAGTMGAGTTDAGSPPS